MPARIISSGQAITTLMRLDIRELEPWGEAWERQE
jgi:hypothetical protein